MGDEQLSWKTGEATHSRPHLPGWTTVQTRGLLWSWRCSNHNRKAQLGHPWGMTWSSKKCDAPQRASVQVCVLVQLRCKRGSICAANPTIHLWSFCISPPGLGVFVVFHVLMQINSRAPAADNSSTRPATCSDCSRHPLSTETLAFTPKVWSLQCPPLPMPSQPSFQPYARVLSHGLATMELRWPLHHHSH